MHALARVEALEGYRLRLWYVDGTEGVVDLTDLVGKGVFAVWNDPSHFSEVSVDPVTGAPTWPGGLDLCPDSLFDEIIGHGGMGHAYGVAETKEK